MSCFIVDKENIQTQSEFIAALLNEPTGYHAKYRMSAPDALTDVFRDCKTVFGYDAHRIYRKLYIANIRAWNARYNDNVREFSKYESTEAPTDLLQLYMNMQCYLYQCEEDPVYNTPLYKAIEELTNKLAHTIARNAADAAGKEWK